MIDTDDMYRYHNANGDLSNASVLEEEFTGYSGRKYAIATNSCSSAMFISLKCSGVNYGERVFIPAFTFIAVPSSVEHCGAQPILVEIEEDYSISLSDLEKKIKQNEDVKVLLLSHMRGYIPNMDELVDICRRHCIFLIEDAAHSLGVKWDNKMTGTFGEIGCYSMQSYKIIGAGEGGMIVTDDEEIAAKAILYSGSYEELWKSHKVRPNDSIMTHFQDKIPCYGLRMNNVIAKTILGQLMDIEERIERYNHIYLIMKEELSQIEGIRFPKRDRRIRYVADSLQFRLFKDSDSLNALAKQLIEHEINLSFFGDREKKNARSYWNWKFLNSTNEYPKTKEIIANSFDMRLSLQWSNEDIERICQKIRGIA